MQGSILTLPEIHLEAEKQLTVKAYKGIVCHAVSQQFSEIHLQFQKIMHTPARVLPDQQCNYLGLHPETNLLQPRLCMPADLYRYINYGFYERNELKRFLLF